MMMLLKLSKVPGCYVKVKDMSEIQSNESLDSVIYNITCNQGNFIKEVKSEPVGGLLQI